MKPAIIFNFFLHFLNAMFEKTITKLSVNYSHLMYERQRYFRRKLK